jgi:hypothetical protein
MGQHGIKQEFAISQIPYMHINPLRLGNSVKVSLYTTAYCTVLYRTVQYRTV